MIQYSQRQVFKMMKSGVAENLKDIISTNHLPYGKNLCEKKLEKYLIRIFKKHSKKNTEPLSTNGSNRTDKSFNLVIASKTPKMHHYPISESVDLCIASAVYQKTLASIT